MTGKQNDHLGASRQASDSCTSCNAAAVPLGKPFCRQVHHSHQHLATAKVLDLHKYVTNCTTQGCVVWVAVYLANMLYTVPITCMS